MHLEQIWSLNARLAHTRAWSFHVLRVHWIAEKQAEFAWGRDFPFSICLFDSLSDLLICILSLFGPIFDVDFN